MFKGFALALVIAFPCAGNSQSIVGNWYCNGVDDDGGDLTVRMAADVTFQKNGVFKANMKLVFSDQDLSTTAFVTYRSKYALKDGLLDDRPIRVRVKKLTTGGHDITHGEFARDIRRSLMKYDGDHVNIVFRSSTVMEMVSDDVTTHCRRKN
ncbi:hypothetical protein [Aliiroseovarius sp. 2305UL8-7]|uniref:hypothetical protein n=1 Tax=Aliiroseovarius conchicola TaxID=3121637 RepID=UPI0035295BC3